MRVSEYVPHGIAGVSAVFAVFAFQQSSELTVADYAERIRSNELSIQSSAERLRETAGDLEKLTDRIESSEEQKTIRELRERLAALESELATLKDRPVTAGAGPSAEAVAAVLVRDHAEQIRGPAGPAGSQGPKGEPGARGEPGVSAAGTGGNTGNAVVIDAGFTSNYEEKYLGATKVTLLGCTGPGARVECNLLLEATGGADDPEFWANRARVALPSADWIAGETVTIGSESSYVLRADLVPGVPNRMSFAFNLPSGGHDGLLALEINRNGGGQILWRNVALGN